MKIKSLLFAMLLLAISWQASAQKIILPSPDFKKDMLSAFEPGNDLELTSSQKEELKKSNSGFLDEVIDIAGGSDSDDAKIKKITDLTKKQNSKLGGILGDSAVKDYRKKVKKQVAPFKRKYKLATLII
ncbi:hypothetical protein SAMN04489724_0799 [Algoriphagus locisalis]|uniref:Uncharacterized protein n=1 Tax=Algoriphagus locisalis TaxID=305507 RepID=A0A1I6Y327_9BACT|nr:hypothetical protein [Algoriphagus locisalis]SFT44793.1 hypothetical protein SAMN04489724_0799 [Algoriphagus locisalis]